MERHFYTYDIRLRKIRFTLQMKILTLRIYNPTPDYDEMYKLHVEHDPNSVFLTASNVSEPSYDPATRILVVPGTESLVPGILEKTIKGIQYCLDHFSFDILIRSNMSTIFDYSKLTEPITYGGHVWTYKVYNVYKPVWFRFVSGCCTFMNKDICQQLVKGTFKQDLPDDVAIGYFLRHLPITFETRYCESSSKSDACVYRFRADMSRYDQRQHDIQRMKEFYSTRETVLPENDGSSETFGVFTP